MLPSFTSSLCSCLWLLLPLFPKSFCIHINSFRSPVAMLHGDPLFKCQYSSWTVCLLLWTHGFWTVLDLWWSYHMMSCLFYIVLIFLMDCMSCAIPLFLPQIRIYWTWSAVDLWWSYHTRPCLINVGFYLWPCYMDIHCSNVTFLMDCMSSSMNPWIFDMICSRPLPILSYDCMSLLHRFYL